jgi:hypothetical protein
MHETIQHSGWQILMVAIPVVCLLLIVVFRLDQVIFRPKQSQKLPRPASGTDKDGEPIVCDPDGRRWRKPRRGR